KELEINIASEYLVMASELLKIKSRMLLPEPAYMEEEEGDPRETLMEQLLEYQNYKQYDEQLDQLKQENDKIFIKAPHDLQEQEAEGAEIEISLSDLLSAYQKVRSRVTLERPKNITIQREPVSMEDAEAFLSTRFKEKDILTFDEIFTFHESKQMVVAVFMTILDHVKSGVLGIIIHTQGSFEIERLSHDGEN